MRAAAPGPNARDKVGRNPRAILVLIVQRCTIELFGAHGVAVAPAGLPARQSPDRPPSHVVGVVDVSVRARRARITLSTSDATLARTSPGAADPSARLEWLRELTNQLAGRIANRFARHRVPMKVGLPTTSKSGDRKAAAGAYDPTDPCLSLTFHALRDTVQVTLSSGAFEDDELSTQPEPLASSNEGDIILF